MSRKGGRIHYQGKRKGKILVLTITFSEVEALTTRPSSRQRGKEADKGNRFLGRNLRQKQ